MDTPDKMHSLLGGWNTGFYGWLCSKDIWNQQGAPLPTEGGLPTLLGHYSLLSVFKDLSVISQEYGAQYSATGIILICLRVVIMKSRPLQVVLLLFFFFKKIHCRHCAPILPVPRPTAPLSIPWCTSGTSRVGRGISSMGSVLGNEVRLW